MISSAQQLKVAKQKLKQLKASLHKVENEKNNLDPLIYELDYGGLSSLVQQINEEIVEYERLVQPHHTSFTDECPLMDLPELLIKARLVRNWTQGQLADKLDLKPQQIQRYEANGYQGAGFAQLVDIQMVLGLDATIKAHLVNFDGFELPEDIDLEKLQLLEDSINSEQLLGV